MAPKITMAPTTDNAKVKSKITDFAKRHSLNITMAPTTDNAKVKSKGSRSHPRFDVACEEVTSLYDGREINPLPLSLHERLAASPEAMFPDVFCLGSLGTRRPGGWTATSPSTSGCHHSTRRTEQRQERGPAGLHGGGNAR